MLELSEQFTLDAQTIAWGRMGSGPPLVAVHGTPFSAQVWRRIVPNLTHRWQVYFFYLLGYGQSAMEEGQDVSLGRQNQVMCALLDHWGLECPDVLAHDFGGATALRAHLLDGRAYRRLTLINPVAIRPWGSPFVAHVSAHEMAFSGMPAYAHEALVEAYLKGAAHRPLSAEALEVYKAPWQGPVGQAAFYRQIAQMDQRFTDAIEPLLTPLSMPVHLMWGEQDDWIPLQQGRTLADKLGVELHVVPNAGHLVQEDAPEAIVAALLSMS
ncbi:MAG: alpha/beta hydrolase [Pseudomonadota bacterium]